LTRLVGGRTLYGLDLGVLMLDTVFPRPLGDIGNARTWPFPVRYKVVKGATSRRVVQRPDDALRDAFIEAARELEADGVRAITTSCGFLALYQRELAAAVSVPVLTSALLQVPLAAQLIGPERKVGILVMSREDLTERHFEGVGFSSAEIPVAVAALTEAAVFRQTYLGGLPEADSEVLERELVELASGLTREHPDVGALVLECTNFVPYGPAIRRATGLPVFELYSLVMQAWLATTGTDVGSTFGGTP
jgi:hypothetical protein